MKVLVFIAAIAVVCVPAITAQDSDQTNSNQTNEETLLINTGDEAPDGVAARLNVFTAWDFVRMILILGAVIAAIYGIFYLLKRTGNPKLQENRLIRVLSSKPLSNGKTLHLVEVGNQVFLVGAAENSVGLVSEISDKETLDGIHLQATAVQEGAKRSFGEVLSQMFGREQPSTQEVNRNPVAFLRQQRQRVKQM